MFKRIAQALWGKFEDPAELKKFGKLAVIFFFIIGIYWGLRPLKDGIFISVVGIDWQPIAKMASLFIIVPLVILYSKLIDVFPRNQVFYVLLSIYGSVALFFAFVFSFYIDLGTVVASKYNFIGWAWYWYIESFGSLVVALFWAFTTDISKPESAKRGFPIIYLLGQAGNMLGPLVLRASRFGFTTSGPIIGIISALMFLTAFLMWVFVNTTPKKQLEGYEMAANGTKKQKKKEEPGFLDGLKLLVSNGYLLAITFIIVSYEVIVTMLDFFFKSAAAAHYTKEIALSTYLADYAVWTGVVATLCVLFGINNIHRKLGTAASLILLPILIAVAVLTLRISPTLAAAFWIMVFSKAVNYALTQPTIKQLYIPTSKDTKYKAQAWIEMFGSRGSKAIGSGINSLRGVLKGSMGAQAGIAMFMTISAGVSFGLIGIWLFVALYAARIYNKAIAEKKVIC